MGNKQDQNEDQKCNVIIDQKAQMTSPVNANFSTNASFYNLRNEIQSPLSRHIQYTQLTNYSQHNKIQESKIISTPTKNLNRIFSFLTKQDRLKLSAIKNLYLLSILKQNNTKDGLTNEIIFNLPVYKSKLKTTREIVQKLKDVKKYKQEILENNLHMKFDFSHNSKSSCNFIDFKQVELYLKNNKQLMKTFTIENISNLESEVNFISLISLLASDNPKKNQRNYLNKNLINLNKEIPLTLEESKQEKIKLNRLVIQNNCFTELDFFEKLSNYICNTHSLKELIYLKNIIKTNQVQTFYENYNYIDKILSIPNFNISLKSLTINEIDLSLKSIRFLFENMKKNKVIKKLDLSKNNLCEKMVFYLADYIKENKSLTDLVLDSNKIKDIGCINLCSALKYNETLTLLSIKKNQIKDPGFDLLFNYLQISKLKTIDISDNIASSNTLIRLKLVFKKNKSINEMHLRNCKRNFLYKTKNFDGTNKTNEYLTLNCKNNIISCNDDISSVFFYLNIESTLSLLDISNNKLNTTEIKKLSLSLSKNINLKSLNLSGNLLDKESFKHISSGLINNKNLISLDLTNTDLKCIKSVKWILIMLRINRGLKIVNLSKNIITFKDIHNIYNSLQYKLTSCVIHLLDSEDINLKNISYKDLKELQIKVQKCDLTKSIDKKEKLFCISKELFFKIKNVLNKDYSKLLNLFTY